MTRLMVTGGFVVAFLAGLVVGLTRTVPQGERGANADDQSRDRGSWLVEQLGLDAAQQEQMKAIWEEASRSGYRRQRDERRRMKEEFDAAIVGLIPPDQRQAYDQLRKSYDARVAEMEAEWRRAFQDAVERTRAILTPEQREKYESILSKQQWEGGPRGRYRGTTRPATQPVNGQEK